MRIPFRLLIFLVVLNAVSDVSAQTGKQIPIGTWRNNLPLSRGVSIAGDKGSVYCATPNGIIILNKSDGTVELITRANGLSDVNISGLNYHAPTKTLIVGYKNGNVDLIKEKTVINLGDIKRATTIQGSKSIHAIRVFDDFAYLCCNFGIVVLDLTRQEVKTTLYPAEQTEFYDLTGDDQFFYIATSKGIYKANRNHPALAYSIAWSLLPGVVATRACTHLALFEGDVYFIREGTNIIVSDTVFKVHDDVLSIYQTDAHFSNVSNSRNRLLTSADGFLFIQSPGTPEPVKLFSYADNLFAFPQDAFIDPDNESIIWIADRESGLVKSVNIWEVSVYKPDGPPNSNVFTMSHSNGQLWVATGAWDLAYSPIYISDGLYNFTGTDWNAYRLPDTTSFINSVVGVTIDPADAKHVFAACYGFGVVECREGSIVNRYNTTNSTLQGINLNSPNDMRISGVAYDADGRVWVANSSCPRPLCVRNADGTWKSFTFNNFVNNQMIGPVVVDRSGLKWMIVHNMGLLVASTEGDELVAYRFLNDQLNNGSLSTKSILSIAEDKDGQIWVGTSKGVSVFYNPAAILETGSTGWDSQKISVSQGGYNQYLLDAEEVSAIYVDGANRKWFGTKAAGLFLVSPDGTEELLHFTTANSPLLGNSINSLAMDEATGELFIGTDQGICSYRTDATGGGDTYGDVYAFPNPVAHDYDGAIAISGLVSNADIKITDLSGNLVYSTRANGGTAMWNGKLFSGERAATGVYLVFCSNADGSATKTTKILFFN